MISPPRHLDHLDSLRRRHAYQLNSWVGCTFVDPAKGLKNIEAPHINKDSSPLAVLMLFFTEIFSLLVEQTNL